MIRKFAHPQDELLTILMEECGELVQACAKNIRREEFSSKELTDEIGDVISLINIAHEYDLISWADIEAREQVKREKLKRWSNLLAEDD